MRKRSTASTSGVDAAAHRQVISDVCAVMTPAVMRNIEHRNPARSRAAQLDLLQHLETSDHRFAAVVRIISELKVNPIPELEDGLADLYGIRLISYKIEHGLAHPDLAALVGDKDSSSKVTTP